MENKGSKVLGATVVGLIIVIAVMGYAIYDLYSKQNVKNNDDKVDNKVDKVSIKIDNSKDYVYDADYKYDNKYTKYAVSKSVEETTDENKFARTGDGFDTIFSKNGWNYIEDLKVPYVNLNSNDAKDINKKLEDLYMDYAKKFDENAVSTDAIILNLMLTYYTYSYDNILSIVVTHGVQGSDVIYPEYLVYNFDLKTGNLISFSDILDKLNYDANALNDKIKSKYESVLISILGKEYAMQEYDYLDYKQNSIDASYDKYLKDYNNNNLLYFINNDGKLCFVSYLYMPAGRGFKYHLVVID